MFDCLGIPSDSFCRRMGNLLKRVDSIHHPGIQKYVTTFTTPSAVMNIPFLSTSDHNNHRNNRYCHTIVFKHCALFCCTYTETCPTQLLLLSATWSNTSAAHWRCSPMLAWGFLALVLPCTGQGSEAVSFACTITATYASYSFMLFHTT